MRTDKMAQAEAMRYAKIQRLVDLLCQKDETILDKLAEESFHEAFNVGKKIHIDGNHIIIKKQSYTPCELQKITINTEGSLSIYGNNGRKLCGWIDLNVSVANIELFCLWARKHHVSAEVVSGKGERIFQFSILAIGILAIVLFRVLKILNGT